ncbi:hypothetical protein, partial [Klebsiella pneumoniae]|uniref:hypothetical protein n=1 Tax=Klebsiella pneumoniae TaxID=573 RepID=UPI00350FE5D5
PPCGTHGTLPHGPDSVTPVIFPDVRDCGKQVNSADGQDCGKQVNSADGQDCGKQVNFTDIRDCGKQVNYADSRDCGKQVKLGKHYGKYSNFSIPPYVSNKLRGRK